MSKKENIDKKDLMWRIIIGSILLIIFLSYYFIKINYTSRGMINNYLNKRDGKTLTEKLDKKIKSGNLSIDYEIDKTLKDIELLDLNTINLPIVINISDVNSSDVNIDSNSLQKAKWLLDKLKGKGINIILEPYPWIANGSQYETEYNPTDTNAFFNNWKNNVLKPLIDDIAIPYRVNVLNIATGFNNLEEYETEFSDMIDFTRKYYKGLITYRTSYWTTANWTDEATKEQVAKLDKKYDKKLNNSIFSKVDFISIAAYFELTDNDVNSVDNLEDALISSKRFNRNQEIKKQIQNFNNKWQKPIFFGELGFPRTTKASVEPWNPFLSNSINNQEQANGFEAYKNVFEDEPWFLGFSYFAIGKEDDQKMYYPSDETVEVIKQWFND